MEQSVNAIRIAVPWISYGLVALALLFGGAAAWLLFSGELSRGLGALAPRSGAPFATAALGVAYIIFCLAALACVGYAIVRSVNTSVLAIENGNLTASHGPLPWMGAASLPVADIEAVVLSSHLDRPEPGAQRGLSPPWGGSLEFWRLEVRLSPGAGKRMIPLTPKLTEEEVLKDAGASLARALSVALETDR